ncbi:MAG: NFACT RNA binding domain-containing protein [archaeon]
MQQKKSSIALSGKDENLIIIDLSKSIEENATAYFESAKEARKKIEGMKKAVAHYEQKQKNASATGPVVSKQKAKVLGEKQKSKWFMNYRWFYTSDGFLVVGGRDAHSNEEVVKKRMQKDDVYFHAEVFGAPHCIIISEKKPVPLQSKKEAAIFAVTFSKAWEEGRPAADSYSVRPEQVSKTPNPGESLGTGAFVIRGEREWFKKTPLNCAIGFCDAEKKLMCAPLSAVKKHCSFFMELKQGSMIKTDAAKRLKNIFAEKGFIFSIDDFVSAIPSGSFNL